MNVKYLSISVLIVSLSIASLQAQTQPDTSKESWKTGLSVQPIDQSLAKYLDLPSDLGVIVAQTEEGTSGSKTGIKVGDVITHLNGAEVNTLLDIIHSIKEDNLGAGDTVTFTVSRNGLSRDIGVLLESQEDWEK